MKPYLVIGGNVISKNDGSIHYVNAHVLRRLYGLSVKDCYLAEEHDKILIDRIIRYQQDVEILRPKYDGEYRVKQKEEVITSIK